MHVPVTMPVTRCPCAGDVSCVFYSSEHGEEPRNN